MIGTKHSFSLLSSTQNFPQWNEIISHGLCFVCTIMALQAGFRGHWIISSTQEKWMKCRAAAFYPVKWSGEEKRCPPMFKGLSGRDAVIFSDLPAGDWTNMTLKWAACFNHERNKHPRRHGLLTENLTASYRLLPYELMVIKAPEAQKPHRIWPLLMIDHLS